MDLSWIPKDARDVILFVLILAAGSGGLVKGSRLYILVCCGISPGRVSQIQTEIEREPLDRRLKEIIEDFKAKP